MPSSIMPISMDLSPVRRCLSAAAALLLAGCSTSLRLANPRPGESMPRVLWTQEVGEQSPASYSGHVKMAGNGAPAVTTAGIVIAPSRDALVAFSPGGQRLWEFRAGSDFQSPAVDADGRVLARWKGGIAQLDAGGKTLWSKNMTTVDALADGHGGAYILEEKSLSAVDASGKELWRVATRGQVSLLPTGPALAWGKREGSNPEDEPRTHVQRLDPRGRSLSEVVLEHADHPIVVASDRLLSARTHSNGGFYTELYTFDPSGKEIGAQIKLVARGSPVLIDDEGTLYTDNGTALGPDGAVRWRFEPAWIDGRYHYTPQGVNYALGPGHALYVGAVSQLENGNGGTAWFLFAARADGSQRWAMWLGADSQITQDADLALAPQLAVGPDGILYVAADGKLSAIDTGVNGKPPVAWSKELSAGRSPLALGFTGAASAALPAAASAAPIAANETTGVTASAGARFDVKKGAKVAVLNFALRTTDVAQSDAGFLSDVVRGALLSALPGVDVIDRENLIVLLQASGKSLADCEGECEVDTGRRIGADLVVSGELLRFGRQLKLSLRLHEAAGGKLLSSAVAAGDTLDQLEQRARSAASSLAQAVSVAP